MSSLGIVYGGLDSDRFSNVLGFERWLSAGLSRSIASQGVYCRLQAESYDALLARSFGFKDVLGQG